MSPTLKSSLHELDHPAETDVVISRPLSLRERSWLNSRSVRGASDALPLITLDCSISNPIADEDVVLAWAVLRLRHPIFASRISPEGSTPELICTSSRTASQALERARAHIEFSVFDDRDSALEALREQWDGLNPTRAVNIHCEMCIVWQKDTTGSLGHYLFGMQTVHYQLDGRRRLDVMRQFVELLSAPWMAQEELDAHFAAQPPPSPRIPISIERRFPGLDVSSGNDLEQRGGQEVYDEFIGRAAVPFCGLPYDGIIDPQDVVAHSIRHVFPESTTAHIVRACKAQNVTVTQLFQAAWIVAVIEVGREHFGDTGGSRNALPLHNGSYHFTHVMYLDLVQYTKAQPVTIPDSDDLDVCLKSVSFPSLVSVPHSLAASQDQDVLVWDVARRAKASHAAFLQSPNFWPILARFQSFVEYFLTHQSAETARPFMPVLSSIGNIADVFPSHIRASTGPNGRDGSSKPKDIHIRDMLLFVKIPLIGGMTHVWTFDGRMTVQMIHNGRSVSPALGDKYFGRVVDVLTRIGQS